MKHHNAGLKQELEKLSREAARREAFERRAAELEGENNKLRQNIRVRGEIPKRGSGQHEGGIPKRGEMRVREEIPKRGTSR